MPYTRRLPILKTIAALTFSTLVALSVTIVPAHADERRDGHHDDHDRGGDHGRDRYRDDRGRRGYPAPPVVYAPYYAPPPVVYGPSVGVYLPGIAIAIH